MLPATRTQPARTDEQSIADALADHPLLLADLHGAGLEARASTVGTVDLEGTARQQVATLSRILHRAWCRSRTRPATGSDVDQLRAELELLRDVAAGGGLAYLAAFDALAPASHSPTPDVHPAEARRELLRQLDAILTLGG